MKPLCLALVVASSCAIPIISSPGAQTADKGRTVTTPAFPDANTFWHMHLENITETGGTEDNEGVIDTGLLDWSKIFMHAGLAPTGRVLETSCKYGMTARYFGMYLDGRRGGDYIGVDHSSTLIAWAKGHITSTHKHVRFGLYSHSEESLSWRDRWVKGVRSSLLSFASQGSLDLVILAYDRANGQLAAEHVERELRESFTLLKAGGRTVVHLASAGTTSYNLLTLVADTASKIGYELGAKMPGDLAVLGKPATGLSLTNDNTQTLSHSSKIRTAMLAPQSIVRMIGGGSQEQNGRIHLLMLSASVGLAPNSRVLEPGCGYGRNARILANYLDAERGGEFHGFDIARSLVEWGTRHYTENGYPHVRLKWVDIFNKHYSYGNKAFQKHLGKSVKTGRGDASEFRFPYEDDYFDVVFAPSVWTHLMPADARNYLMQTLRVLKPGGRAYLNFYVIPEGGQIWGGPYKAKVQDESGQIVAQGNEGKIAYQEKWLREAAIAIGFEFVAIHFGSNHAEDGPYSSGKHAITGITDRQDRILLFKPAKPT